MVVNKRRKVSRMRGTRTHGWGRLHRNSGNRGGAGYAGTGKKAHVKKQWRWDNPFGKFGFKMQGVVTEHIAINVEMVEHALPGWVADKKASQSGQSFTVDLGALGFTKLLGSGKVTRKIIINVDAASEGAMGKVKAAGGEVHLKRDGSAGSSA